MLLLVFLRASLVERARGERERERERESIFSSSRFFAEIEHE
jgi:hypothetical protein